MKTVASAVAVILCCACGEAALSPEGDPAIGAEDLQPREELEMGGLVTEYEVPVPPRLEEYAYFDLGSIGLRIQGSTVRLGYGLPVALTGLPRVGISMTGRLRGDGKPLELEGEHARARCTASVQGAVFTCMVTYRDLDLDTTRTMSHLEATFPIEELEPRGEVAGIFGDDPLGIIHDLRVLPTED